MTDKRSEASGKETDSGRKLIAMISGKCEDGSDKNGRGAGPTKSGWLIKESRRSGERAPTLSGA